MDNVETSSAKLGIVAAPATGTILADGADGTGDGGSPGTLHAVSDGVLLRIGFGVVAMVLLLMVSTAGSVPLAERAPTLDWNLRPSDRTVVESLLGPSRAPDPANDRDPSHLDLVVGAVLEVLLSIGLLVVVALGLREGWRRRPRLRWRPPDGADFDAVDRFVASVTAEAAAQRTALERGTARNAIVDCWRRLETLLAASGTQLDPAETSTELTVRALERYDIDARAIRNLSSLYREARFSRHELGEPTRRAALDALDEIHDGLRRSGRAGTAR